MLPLKGDSVPRYIYIYIYTIPGRFQKLVNLAMRWNNLLADLKLALNRKKKEKNIQRLKFKGEKREEDG